MEAANRRLKEWPTEHVEKKYRGHESIRKEDDDDDDDGDDNDDDSCHLPCLS